MARGAGRITRLEVRWWVFPIILGVILLIVVIGRAVGTKVAEAIALVLLLVPVLWYVITSIPGKRKADTVPPEISYLTGVGGISPSSDVGGDVGGGN